MAAPIAVIAIIAIQSETLQGPLSISDRLDRVTDPGMFGSSASLATTSAEPSHSY
jgi:hypothetical protein